MQLFTGQQTAKPENSQPENEVPSKIPAPEPIKEDVKQPEPVKEAETLKFVLEPIQKPNIPPPVQLPEQKSEVTQPIVENYNHSAHEDLNIVNKLIEKHESRIKESQCEVIQTSSKIVSSHERSSTNVVTKNNFNHVVERQGSMFFLMLNFARH